MEESCSERWPTDESLRALLRSSGSRQMQRRVRRADRNIHRQHRVYSATKEYIHSHTEYTRTDFYVSASPFLFFASSGRSYLVSVNRARGAKLGRSSCHHVRSNVSRIPLMSASTEYTPTPKNLACTAPSHYDSFPVEITNSGVLAQMLHQRIKDTTSNHKSDPREE